MIWLFFMAVLFVQFQSTQLLSYACIFILASLSLAKALKNSREIKKKDILMFYVWTLMIFIMLRSSFVLSIETVIEVLWLSLGSICFIFIATAESVNRLEVLKKVALAGSLGAIINLLASFMSWYNPLFIDPPYAGSRWVGGFDGPNESAGFYVMIFALILGLYLEKQYSFIKLLVSGSVLIPLIYSSFSRGALLSLLGIALVFVCSTLFKSRRKMILLGAYSLIVWFFYNQYFDSLMLKFNEVRSNASERDGLFVEAFRLFKQSPIFGHGLGSFAKISPIFDTVPHSDYLLFMVSGGIIGVAALTLFYFSFIIESFKRKHYPELFVLLVFVTQAFTFNNIVRGRLSILFWVIVVVIYLGTAKRKSEAGQTAEVMTEPAQGSFKKLESAV